MSVDEIAAAVVIAQRKTGASFNFPFLHVTHTRLHFVNVRQNRVDERLAHFILFVFMTNEKAYLHEFENGVQ